MCSSDLVLVHALAAEKAGAPRRRVERWWLAYGALIVLGGYLNEMSLLVLAAHAVTVLLARYGQKTVERWLWAAGGGAALVAPLVLLSINEHAALGWVSPPHLTDLRVLAQDYFGAEAVAAGLLAICAVVALLPPAGTWRWLPGGAKQTGAEPGPPWWRGGGVSLPSVAAPLLVLPAAILMIESILLHPLYVDRYVLYGEAGAALLAGAGLYRIGRWAGDASGRRALVWLPGVIVCLCFLVLQLAPQQHARRPGSRRYDYGGSSRYVGANARPGDGILFFGKFYRKAKLGYPGDFADTSDFAQAATPLQVGNFQGRDKPVGVTLPLMLRYRRIWVYGVRPSLHRPEAALRAESTELLRRYIPIRQRQFHGILVTLWLRR